MSATSLATLLTSIYTTSITTSNTIFISTINSQSHQLSLSFYLHHHVGHLIGHLVNLHDQHHNLSNTTSISIINYQSLVSKVLSRYLHSPGSHQSTRFLESVTHSLTDTITSRASCDAKNQYNISKEDLVAPCRWWAGLASPSPPAVMVRSSSSSSVEILFFLFAKESSCTSTFLERIFERQTWIQFKTQNKVLHQRLNQKKICFYSIQGSKHGLNVCFT